MRPLATQLTKPRSQGKLEDLEKELLVINENSEKLSKSAAELHELQLVLEKAGAFFDDGQHASGSNGFPSSSLGPVAASTPLLSDDTMVRPTEKAASWFLRALAPGIVCFSGLARNNDISGIIAAVEPTLVVRPCVRHLLLWGRCLCAGMHACSRCCIVCRLIAIPSVLMQQWSAPLHRRRHLHV